MNKKGKSLHMAATFFIKIIKKDQIHECFANQYYICNVCGRTKPLNLDFDTAEKTDKLEIFVFKEIMTKQRET